ncbi:MAG: hypothetical protein IIV63_01270, partial [Clostridia bacterium]|nr:hypothetical protein [Clostridia bacterium]
KQPPGQGAPYVSEGNVKIHNRQDGNNQKLWRVTMEYSKEDLMEAKKQPSTKKTFLFALGDCSFPRSAFALFTLGDSPRREVSFAFSRSTGFPFATKKRVGY